MEFTEVFPTRGVPVIRIACLMHFEGSANNSINLAY